MLGILLVAHGSPYSLHNLLRDLFQAMNGLGVSRSLSQWLVFDVGTEDAFAIKTDIPAFHNLAHRVFPLLDGQLDGVLWKAPIN
jgi:hypothetical protein